MLLQHGGEPFETGRDGEVGTELGLAGCKERMRQAVGSTPAETAGPQAPAQPSAPPTEIAVPPAETAQTPPEGTPEPPAGLSETTAGTAPEVPTEGAEIQPNPPPRWQCDKAHTFTTPDAPDGKVPDACPVC